ncbi:Coiled-coil domain-containing protein 25 [Ceratobasidium sp. 370]|nr:Coiled-coil domain-containing protein 25 [Ceratobasidium sp. 370]
MCTDEDLIRYGWPQDVWFHVDKLSSAHVYLRLPPTIESWENIPQELLVDCAQLVKANSIEGNKKDNLTIIYTPWDNLKKKADAERARQREAEKAARSYDNLFTGADDEEEEDEDGPKEKKTGIALEEDFM